MTCCERLRQLPLLGLCRQRQGREHRRTRHHAAPGRRLQLPHLHGQDLELSTPQGATSSAGPACDILPHMRTRTRLVGLPLLAVLLASTVARGDDTGCDTSGDTGQTDSCPASGSRMMPLKNELAAPFGRPGRTVTVIRRALRPSM